MITLENASDLAYSEFDKIYPIIETKFHNIDFDNTKKRREFYVKCDFNKNSESELNDIIIRFIPDFERRNPKVPKDLKEYYNQGGGEKLMEKLSDSDKNAWKCEVFSNLSNGKKLEYGIGINEKNFSKEKVIELFSNYLIKK
ncbi:hypothetical protein FNB79_12090 [Formosa sediminum]|uniref:Uncharacterized protein n=1 Tax=Formosa sediminum TaxID=2594004 RepID=A0A516GT18_9FLAO|nr:hypothetical protein [Formosa sediminum]QDO94667.1 hypothetical protein FNB79_12090 [Formosa sediminum]